MGIDMKPLLAMILLHSRSTSLPAAESIAPATPAPNHRSSFAAFTMVWDGSWTMLP